MKTLLRTLFCGAALLVITGFACAQSSFAEQRQAVLEAGRQGAAGLPLLTQVMKNPEALIRRAAVRSLADLGQAGWPLLFTALKSDTDDLVRRTALRLLLKTSPENRDEALPLGIENTSPLVRLVTVESLAATQPYDTRSIELLRQAQQDKNFEVSRVAVQALWPYHKDAVSVRERPDNKDRLLTLVQTIPLKQDGWKFKIDEGHTGHLQNWFSPQFDDSAWENISIGKSWESQGHADYDGAAWYRTTLMLPEKPGNVEADLVFEGVDEGAWIWVNGQYVGNHDEGEAGRSKPFAVDVGDALKWNAPNQISIRVLDREYAGGIWKPVSLEIIK